MPELTQEDQERREAARQQAAANRQAAEAEMSAAAQQVADEPPAEPALPPVREGYRRHYYDTPIVPEPLPPLADRVWSHCRSRADECDTQADQLYALVASLHLTIRENDGSLIGPYDTDTASQINLAAAHEATDQLEAMQSAIRSLRSASNALRTARLALAPYVAEDRRQRGY